MKEGGYLLITVVTALLLAVIISLILVDVTKTRRQQKVAQSLIDIARRRYAEQSSSAHEHEVRPAYEEEMQILHDELSSFPIL